MTSSLSSDFGWIGAAQLFVEGQQLVRRGQLLFGHLVEVVAVGLLEREPQRQRQEIAQRQGGFVERAPSASATWAGERGLARSKRSKASSSWTARLFVVVGEALTHGF